MRHVARRAISGEIQIVDTQFNWVRVVLPYDYRFTCNADQWDHAERICAALEGPMASKGIVRLTQDS
jgi:hypothetical protein